jgi:hypothetical protein
MHAIKLIKNQRWVTGLSTRDFVVEINRQTLQSACGESYGWNPHISSVAYCFWKRGAREMARRWLRTPLGMARAQDSMASIVLMGNHKPTRTFFRQDRNHSSFRIDIRERILAICVFKRCLKNVFVAGTNPLGHQKRRGAAIGRFPGGQAETDRNALQSITPKVCSPVTLYLVDFSPLYPLFRWRRTLRQSVNFPR